MSPVEFSTLLAGWCEKHHFSNQRAAAAELGVSYGTLCGWLSRVRGLPCRLTRAAVLRRMRQWRRKRGLNQREALAILGEGDDPAKMSNWERGKMVPRNMGELLAKMEAAK